MRARLVCEAAQPRFEQGGGLGVAQPRIYQQRLADPDADVRRPGQRPPLR